MILDVLRAFGRRWYVLLVGLVLTAGLAYGAYLVSPTQYNARGLVLLLPSDAAVGVGGNPFLTLDGLEQPAGIVVAYFASETAQDDVRQQSPDAEYVVGIDDSTRGPVIAIDVTDSSAASALATLEYIAAGIPVQLERLQGEVGAPPESVITSMPLTMDRVAEPDIGGTLRLVIAAVVTGVVLTGVVAFALDGLLLRRSRTRQSGRADPPEADGTDDGDAEADVDIDVDVESAEAVIPRSSRPQRSRAR